MRIHIFVALFVFVSLSAHAATTKILAQQTGEITSSQCTTMAQSNADYYGYAYWYETFYTSTDTGGNTLYTCEITYTNDPDDPDYNDPNAKSDADLVCESIKPTFVTVAYDLGSGNSYTWNEAGCTFTSNTLWIETPSGSFRATVASATAIESDVATVDETDVDVTSDDPDVSDSSDDFAETTDPTVDCPYSYYAYGGTTYCYYGDDANQGAEYADGSERINYWDGSYDVVASDGTTTSYNPDGSLKDPGTAPTGSGQGPGTGNDGCPAWAPEWMCGGSVTDGTGDDPSIPVENIDPMANSVSYDSGLATTGVCPPPETVSINIAGNAINLEFAYQPFCDLAAMLRGLVIAFANLGAAYIVYRGIV